MAIRADEAALCWMILYSAAVSVSVTALDCQHSCDCGFAWDGGDKDLTLRYEVISGLVGAFSPLVLAGLGLLIYKKCVRQPASGVGQGGAAASLPGAGAPMATAYPYGGGGGRGSSGYGGWRGGGGGGGGEGYGDYRGVNGSHMGGEPTSLYGESDDDMTGSDSQAGRRPNNARGGGLRPGTVNSRYTNIHRNVKSDLANKWLRNVNLRKY